MKIAIVRSLALGGYFGLLILTLIWHAWLAPSLYFPVALVLLVTTVPLLLPLRGMLHGIPRSHVWAIFLSLLYLIHGIGEAVAAPDQRGLAMIEVFLSLMLIVSASLYVRWSQAVSLNGSSAPS